MKKRRLEQPYCINVLITIFLVALFIGIILFGRTSKSEDLTSPMSPVQIFTTTTHVPKITMVNKTPVPHSVLQTLTQRPTPRPTLQPPPIRDISVSQSSQIWAEEAKNRTFKRGSAYLEKRDGNFSSIMPFNKLREEIYNQKMSVIEFANGYKGCIAKYVRALRRVRNLAKNFQQYVNEIENGMHVDLGINETDRTGFNQTKEKIILGAGAPSQREHQYAVALFKIGYDVIESRSDSQVLEWSNTFNNATKMTNLTDADEIRACHRQYQAIDYRIPYNIDAMLDPFSSFTFWDFYRIHLNSTFLLLVHNNATEWAEERARNFPLEPAIIYRPCGLKTSDFTPSNHARMYEAHNEFVRCVVPKKRLLEVCTSCEDTYWSSFRDFFGTKLEKYGLEQNKRIPNFDDFKDALIH